MSLPIHILIFLISIGVIWFFAGLIVDSVDRIARRFKQSGFIVAFFVLGFMTSLSELSVAINAVITNVPQVSAGNLVGASFVLLVFVVPLLAVIGNGVRMNKLFDQWRLLLVLAVIALPAVFFLDGAITRREGIAALLMYGVLLWGMRKNSPPAQVADVEARILPKKKIHSVRDVLTIVISATMVLLAGYLLVQETVYFAEVLNAPKSLVSIIVLSIGTNVPELAIAARAILKKRSDVALGNYLGSAVVNTVILSLLVLAHGSFAVDRSGFQVSFGFMMIGFVLLYLFIRSKDILSRTEGFVLLSIYAGFIAVQIYTLLTFAGG